MKKVITYGTFDLFHEGHYNLLKRAKELGDYLIVGITTEQYDETRGKLNVVDNLAVRIENVRKTGFADEIIVEDHQGQKVEDILKYNIDIFTVGSDWAGKFTYLEDFCTVVYLPRTENISSSLLRQKGHKIIRLGIIGTGRIAGRFVRESVYVRGVYISCVFNPNMESAKNFVSTFGISAYAETIDDFMNQVDAVYIASPHGTHYEYAKKFLSCKKHVLSEKPLAFSEKDVRELYDIAKENNCVLLEAIKTAFCPGFKQLLGIARSGIIGSIRDVEATFTRLTSDGGREKADAVYGGGFTEYGSYTLLPIIKLMGKDFESVQFSSILADNGVDLYTKAFFTYKKGMALSKTGVGIKSEGSLIIAGTQGYILAPSPWWLTKEFEIHYEDFTKVDKYTTLFLGDGLRYELSDFVSSINGYGNKEYKLTIGECLAMARVFESFMLQRRKNGERK